MTAIESASLRTRGTVFEVGGAALAGAWAGSVAGIVSIWASVLQPDLRGSRQGRFSPALDVRGQHAAEDATAAGRIGWLMDQGTAATASSWAHFSHDADIGVVGIGSTKAEAFRQAALALTAVITDPSHVRPVQPVPVFCQAPSDEMLLVEWLNALVYEMAVRRMLFGDFAVEIEGGELRATAYGESVDVDRHEPAVEIKGATLTALQVADTPDGWRVQCVVDV